MPEKKNDPAKPETVKPKNPWPLRITVVVGVVIALLACVYAYLFATSPAAVRVPKLDHAHLRFQLIVDGQPVNFGEEKFQKHYAQACSDEISPDPIHFHDGKDQFMHLHWKGMTGGLVLKNYGWNMVGGADDTLGYRFDVSPIPTRVPIHGSNLPAAQPVNTQLWAYSGDATGHREHVQADFLYQDFETLLGVKSGVGVQRSWLDTILFAKAAAHEGREHTDSPTPAPVTSAATSEPTTGPVKSQVELARIQNLLGNIVVFAQKDKPTDVQVAERFKQLAPIPESSCGG